MSSVNQGLSSSDEDLFTEEDIEQMPISLGLDPGPRPPRRGWTALNDCDILAALNDCDNTPVHLHDFNNQPLVARSGKKSYVGVGLKDVHNEQLFNVNDGEFKTNVTNNLPVGLELQQTIEVDYVGLDPEEILQTNAQLLELEVHSGETQTDLTADNVVTELQQTVIVNNVGLVLEELQTNAQLVELKVHDGEMQTDFTDNIVVPELQETVEVNYVGLGLEELQTNAQLFEILDGEMQTDFTDNIVVPELQETVEVNYVGLGLEELQTNAQLVEREMQTDAQAVEEGLDQINLELQLNVELEVNGRRPNDEELLLPVGEELYEPDDDDAAQSDESEDKPKRRKRIQDKNRRSMPALKNRTLRMEGKSYLGLNKITDGPTTQYKFVKERPARKMKDPCRQACCLKSKNRFCAEFSQEDCRKLFNTFWTNMDWQMRKVHVSALVEYVPTKRTKILEDEKYRKNTAVFRLKKDGKLLQVCKNMFLGTLGLGEWSVRNWCLEAQAGNVKTKHQTVMPNRNRQTLNGVPLAIQFLKDFFGLLPKLPSHYCRADTSLSYLEPVFRSYTDLYVEYKRLAVEQFKPTVSQTSFRSEMKTLKISLFKPKKDQCDTCVSHKLGHVSDTVYNLHQQRKEEARLGKQEDKNLAAENPKKIVAITMDVQAVKLAPCLLASAVYYKTKLCIHNFTIHNQVTRDVTCYLWDESQGGLEATNFATMLVDFLTTYIEQNNETETIIIYSDGCGYQNRNNILSNALLHLSRSLNVTVLQKYLEKGHTQMEVDSVHSTIERKLKNREIYLPTDYISVCRESRKNHQYEVKYLNYDFFKSYSKVKYYTSIRPGFKTGDPVVADLKCLKYDPKGEISYKLKFSDHWQTLPKRPNLGPFVVEPLYARPLKIKPEKFQHLQELKQVIPKHCWSFYDNLLK